MEKRIVAVIILAALVLSMTACGTATTEETIHSTEPILSTQGNIATQEAPSETTPETSEAKGTVILNFYAFSDLLGNLQPSDTAPGAAVLAAKLGELRDQNPEGTVITCVGDALSGTPIAGLVQGKSVMDVLNHMEVDLFVLGNHEFDWGPKDIIPALKMAEMPILNGNIFDNDNGELYGGFEPYQILDIQGVKVGVLGLTTDTTPSIIQAQYAAQLTFEDTVAAAKKWVPEMKENGAEIVVICGHLPMYQDESGNYFGEAAELANEVEGIDVILGGHNQELITGVKIGDTWVAKGDFYGASLSAVELTFDRATRTIVNGEASVCAVALDGAADPEIEACVAVHAEEADRLFNVTIATAATDFEIDATKECEISNWFAEGVRMVAGTDMAFVNPSGIFEGIPAGEIALKKIYTMNPFDNYVVTSTMNGAQIRELWEVTLATDHFVEHKILAFDGLLVTYDAAAPDGQKVVSLKTQDGKEISDDDVFTIATNNYIAGGGNDYELLAGIEWQDTGIIQRDAFKAWIAEKKTLEAGIKGWLTVLNAE